MSKLENIVEDNLAFLKKDCRNKHGATICGFCTFGAICPHDKDLTAEQILTELNTEEL